MSAGTELAVEARGLTKRYGSLTAVAGIDFTVERGACFGFLGPNGAGKSTTMRMIYRACPLDGGSLRILGLEVGDGGNDRAIKRRLGVVPQEYNLDERLSARENLRTFARFYRLAGERAQRRVDELLAFVGLSGRGDAPVVTLSGGMKRRVQIARGLLGEPEILVLDEPTTGLDPQARNALWGQLLDLARRGTTLLLTTHYMDEAEKLCDRLVIMDGGKIVAQGSPAELIARHVPRHVVELGIDDARDRDAMRAAFSARAAQSGELAERLLLYTEEGEALLREVVQARPAAPATLRPANLEDVFLRLTGHGLEGH